MEEWPWRWRPGGMGGMAWVLVLEDVEVTVVDMRVLRWLMLPVIALDATYFPALGQKGADVNVQDFSCI